MPRAAGNDGHREPDERLQQMAEEYRLWSQEKWSFSQIASHFDIAKSTVSRDIAKYQKHLQGLLPQTYANWQLKFYNDYQDVAEMLKETYQDAKPGSMNRVQAAGKLIEAIRDTRALMGVDAATKPVADDEEVPDDYVEFTE